MDENLEEESEIALNLTSYINKTEFLSRDLKSLDRIVEKYFNIKERDKKEEKQVINFLFKYLDLKGKNASILFSHIKNSAEYYNIIKRLHNEYQDKFEFSIVNPLLFQYSFNLIKINEQLKKFLLISFFSFTCLIFLSSFYYYQRNKLNEKLQLYETKLNEYSNIKRKYDKVKNKLEKEIELKNQIQSNFTTLKIQYETFLYSKQQLCEQMAKYKINLEDEITSFKNQIQNEISNLKEKQQENELITKKKLEFEIEKNQKLENELTTAKQNNNNDKNPKNHQNEIESSTNKKNNFLTNKNETSTTSNKNNDKQFKAENKNGKNNLISKISFQIIWLIDFILTSFAFYFCHRNDKISFYISILAFLFDEMMPIFSLIDNTHLMYSINTFFYMFILFYLSRVVKKFKQSFSIIYIIINVACKYYLIIPETVDSFNILNAVNSILIIMVVFFIIYSYRFSINYINLILMLKTIIFLFENNFNYSTIIIPNVAFITIIFLMIYGFFIDNNGVDKRGILGLFFYTILKYYVYLNQPIGKFFYVYEIFVIILEIALIVIFINDYFSCLIACELFVSIFYISAYWYLLFVYSIVIICLSIVIYGIIFDQFQDNYIKIGLMFLLIESLLKYICVIYHTWQKYH